MRRREFTTLLGAALSWPLAARAQQRAVPVVGFLHGGSAGARTHLIAAFHHGLRETGHIEGRHFEIDYRWANNQRDRLPALAADLVRRQVSLITVTGGEADVFVAKGATSTIPIVFIVGTDPVKAGFVARLGRPGGNLTGVNFITAELEAKRVGILHELIPPSMVIAHIVDPNFPFTEVAVAEAETAARSLGRQIVVLKTTTTSESDIDAASATILQVRPGALLVGPGPFVVTWRHKMVALAARHAIPAIYGIRDVAVAGGLMSYGTSLVDAYRLVGVYTGRILKGEKPADLPIVQPTKFELVINLKTAKELGLTIPPSLLARADEVIE